MIIKSMSRKEPSFEQLINYMDSEKTDERYNIFHNCYSETTEDLAREFEENATNLPKRKNGVYLYHEILSIKSVQKLDRELQKEILRKVALRYIEGRASKNLVYGALHNDKEHNLHYHLLISSNEVVGKKRIRLSKAQFETLKVDLERYVLEQYPQLKQERLISLDKTSKISKSEQQKNQVKETFLNALSENNSYLDLSYALQKEGIEIYERGKTLGLKTSSGKKHRMKTLGVEDEYLAFVHQREQEEKFEEFEKVDRAYEASQEAQEPQETEFVTEPPQMHEERSQEHSEAQNMEGLGGKRKNKKEASQETQEGNEFKERLKSLREEQDQENEDTSGMGI